MSINDLSDLWKKIDDERVGMFTTVDSAGRLNSRPMSSLEGDVDGVLWFFTSIESKIVDDIAKQPQANISFAEQPKSFYVSLAGHAELVADRAQYQKLWKPIYNAWFPRGLDDPQLVLIRFTAETAEYWDADSSRMVQFFKIVKAAMSSDSSHPKPDLGTHKNFRLQ